AVDCDFCRHKTMLPLEKGRKRAKLKATEETMPAKEPAAASKSKKETKKNKSQAPNKDINAGLKIPQQKKTPQQHLAKSPAPSKKASQPVGIASQNLSQQSKNKKKKPAQPTPAAAKTQSKTQKQNALLQLAAQLKANAFKDASKSQQNRLQAFLK
uniref:Histone H1-like n=1 Tax=Drosophila rhopaloa TaxID=1041015 RepID=A0A6P4EQB5_DRORH